MMYVSANEKAVSLNLHRYNEGPQAASCATAGPLRLLLSSPHKLTASQQNLTLLDVAGSRPQSPRLDSPASSNNTPPLLVKRALLSGGGSGGDSFGSGSLSLSSSDGGLSGFVSGDDGPGSGP
jgi:hypothetical protein